MRIGAHTLPTVHFYTPSVLETAPSQLRRSSLSLVQMFLTNNATATATATGGERPAEAGDALSHSPAACSIRDLLAR